MEEHDVRDNFSLATASSLGDPTDVATVHARMDAIPASDPSAGQARSNYYRVEMNDTRTLRFHLTNLTRNVDLYVLEQLGGRVCKYSSDCSSSNGGTHDESIVVTLDAGTDHVKVEAASTRTVDARYELQYHLESGPERIDIDECSA